MGSKLIQFMMFATVALSLPLFQNCSGVGFSNASSEGSNVATGGGDTPGNKCQNATLESTTLPIKILLIVDTSGSNVGDSSSPGTDPERYIAGVQYKRSSATLAVRAISTGALSLFKIRRRRPY